MPPVACVEFNTARSVLGLSVGGSGRHIISLTCTPNSQLVYSSEGASLPMTWKSRVRVLECVKCAILFYKNKFKAFFSGQRQYFPFLN